MQNKVDAMVKHLASLSSNRLIISFAPKTLAYSVLKRIGELFPGPSKVSHLHLLHCGVVYCEHLAQHAHTVLYAVQNRRLLLAQRSVSSLACCDALRLT